MLLGTSCFSSQEDNNNTAKASFLRMTPSPSSLGGEEGLHASPTAPALASGRVPTLCTLGRRSCV